MHNVLIRLDVLPNYFADEAGAAKEARVKGAKGKPVPSAKGRKAYPCTHFIYWASSYSIK